MPSSTGGISKMGHQKEHFGPSKQQKKLEKSEPELYGKLTGLTGPLASSVLVIIPALLLNNHIMTGSSLLNALFG